MRKTDQPEGEASMAVDAGVECPLCHDARQTPLEDHLLKRHSLEELAELVSNLVMEREETGTVR